MPEREAALELPIPAGHPAYAGHFPGRPVLPAVVLLAEVMAVVAAQSGRPAHRWRIAQAKFLAAVGPGTPLALDREVLTRGEVRFEVHSPAGMVARGLLAPHEGP